PVPPSPLPAPPSPGRRSGIGTTPTRCRAGRTVPSRWAAAALPGGSAPRVGLRPGVPPQQFLPVPHRPPRHAPRPAGALPLGRGRQAVARQSQGARLHTHPGRILLLPVGEVAPLLWGNTLLVAQPVAVRCCVVPTHQVHRAVRRAGGPRFHAVVLAEAE